LLPDDPFSGKGGIPIPGFPSLFSDRRLEKRLICTFTITFAQSYRGPMSAHIAVLDYDPGWPGRAARAMALIKGQLPAPARRIEHIGSTAVPKMAAKDVIDLQVSTDNLYAAAEAFDGPLAALGFRRSSVEHDHVPAGRTDAADEWVKRLWTRRNHPEGDVNLHVRRVGSPSERLALLFRDWFRAHPEAVPAYAAFKHSLSAAVSDLHSYSDVKDPIVDLVIAVAEPWAAATGWNAK
jgi:GrpB-like predicted nucleotidyltransferase (UPF0157 family)